MKLSRFNPHHLIAALTGLFLASCGSNPFKPAIPTPNPEQEVIKVAEKVNPYPAGSYEHFKFGPYPGTTRTWKNPVLLPTANATNSHVRVDLSTQRGFLMVGDQIAMDYRISSGSTKHKTPIGDFRITEKIKDKRSNLYGKILDSSGGVVKSNADSRKDTPPAGGKFLGASMPYWMRLTNGGIGMHEGNVNSRYASHGCIRTHATAIPILFEKTKIGTQVKISE